MSHRLVQLLVVAQCIAVCLMCASSAVAAQSQTLKNSLSPSGDARSGSFTVTTTRIANGQIQATLRASVTFKKPKPGKTVRPLTLVMLATAGQAAPSPLAGSSPIYSFFGAATALKQFVLKPGRTTATWTVTPPKATAPFPNLWTDCVVVRVSVPGDSSTLVNWLFSTLTLTGPDGVHRDASGTAP